MKICDRCNQVTKFYKIGYFNLEELCLDCIEEEKTHPHYLKAKELELQEVVKKGNLNYPGLYPHLSWAKIKTFT